MEKVADYFMRLSILVFFKTDFRVVIVKEDKFILFTLIFRFLSHARLASEYNSSFLSLTGFVNSKFFPTNSIFRLFNIFVFKSIPLFFKWECFILGRG